MLPAASVTQPAGAGSGDELSLATAEGGMAVDDDDGAQVPQISGTLGLEEFSRQAIRQLERIRRESNVSIVPSSSRPGIKWLALASRCKQAVHTEKVRLQMVSLGHTADSCHAESARAQAEMSSKISELSGLVRRMLNIGTPAPPPQRTSSSGARAGRLRHSQRLEQSFVPVCTADRGRRMWWTRLLLTHTTVDSRASGHARRWAALGSRARREGHGITGRRVEEVLRELRDLDVALAGRGSVLDFTSGRTAPRPGSRLRSCRSATRRRPESDVYHRRRDNTVSFDRQPLVRLEAGEDGQQRIRAHRVRRGYGVGM